MSRPFCRTALAESRSNIEAGPRTGFRRRSTGRCTRQAIFISGHRDIHGNYISDVFQVPGATTGDVLDAMIATYRFIGPRRIDVIAGKSVVRATPKSLPERLASRISTLRPISMHSTTSSSLSSHISPHPRPSEAIAPIVASNRLRRDAGTACGTVSANRLSGGPVRPSCRTDRAGVRVRVRRARVP